MLPTAKRTIELPRVCGAVEPTGGVAPLPVAKMICPGPSETSSPPPSQMVPNGLVAVVWASVVHSVVSFAVDVDTPATQPRASGLSHRDPKAT